MFARRLEGTKVVFGERVRRRDHPGRTIEQSWLAGAAPVCVDVEDNLVNTAGHDGLLENLTCAD
jgi:hypothetical protein